MLHLGPKGLEEAYQSNPEQFKSDFQAAGLTRSKDPLALAWTYRLGLEPETAATPTLGNGTLWFTIAMTFAAFFFFRIPDNGFFSNEWFLPYIAPVFLVPLMAYHTTVQKAWVSMRAFWSLVLGLLALNVVADVYWGVWDYPSYEWVHNPETGQQVYQILEDPLPWRAKRKRSSKSTFRSCSGAYWASCTPNFTWAKRGWTLCGIRSKWASSPLLLASLEVRLWA